MIKRLSELKNGEAGVITSVQPNDLHLKLLEMGCIPGEPVQVKQTAPFGDPISVLVAGYNLSLRLNEAEHIMVETTQA
jgi:ferrous iron transport protein A